jgi:hypothetical protein
LYTDINHINITVEGEVVMQFGKNIQNLIEVSPGVFKSFRAELTNYRLIPIEHLADLLRSTAAQKSALENTNQVSLLGFTEAALRRLDVTYWFAAQTTLLEQEDFVEIPVLTPYRAWPSEWSTMYIPPGTTSFRILARTAGLVPGQLIAASAPVAPPSGGSSFSYLINLEGSSLSVSRVPNSNPIALRTAPIPVTVNHGVVDAPSNCTGKKCGDDCKCKKKQKKKQHKRSGDRIIVVNSVAPEPFIRRTF